MNIIFWGFFLQNNSGSQLTLSFPYETNIFQRDPVPWHQGFHIPMLSSATCSSMKALTEKYMQDVIV